MREHPFIESKRRRVAVLLFTLIALFIQWGLFSLYGEMSPVEALVDSVISIGLLFLFGYLFWFVVDVIRIFQADIVLSAGVLIVWLATVFICWSLGMAPLDDLFYPRFLSILPLRLVVAFSCWVIMLQWYRVITLRRWRTERLLTDAVQTPMHEVVDRIAVKNGSRIHIISVRELSYVQACGDYIMLFTPTGEFLKEQTMKSLEEHLPSSFIRIHRSYIVNVEQIQRVELFGKETYNVSLKTGIVLRASATGYKLLKERLDL